MSLTRVLFVAGGIGALVAAVGCSSTPDSSTDEATASQESAQTGCRTVCPKCAPNQICSKMPCYLDCHTNKPGSCQSDADCRLFDDYCTGCDCRSLSTNQSNPVCSGPGVRCVVAPCGGYVAACVNGACSVRSPNL